MAGTHLAERNTLLIQSYIDALDQQARTFELKWGAGRLPLLVAPELAARFHRQRELVNEAVWETRTVEAVRGACEAMGRAWAALDAEATARGSQPLEVGFWETMTDDGTVVVIARDDPSAWAVHQQGRNAIVFTLDEIGRLLASQTLLAQCKRTFPGGKVTGTRPRRQMDGILPDDPIPF